MSDARLYLAIGIPVALFALNSLAMLAGFFWQGMRYDDLLQPTSISRIVLPT